MVHSVGTTCVGWGGPGTFRSAGGAAWVGEVDPLVAQRTITTATSLEEGTKARAARAENGAEGVASCGQGWATHSRHETTVGG